MQTAPSLRPGIPPNSKPIYLLHSWATPQARRAIRALFEKLADDGEIGLPSFEASKMDEYRGCLVFEEMDIGALVAAIRKWFHE